MYVYRDDGVSEWRLLVCRPTDLTFLKVDKRYFERMMEDEGGDYGRRMDGRIRIWIWR